VLDSSFTSFDDGGMRVSGDDAVFTVQRSLFQDNRATGAQNDGAGIHASRAAHLIISDSSFIRNHASSGEGGALFISVSAPATLSRVSFVNNSANTLGGAISADSGDIHVSGATFESNWAGTYGGALHVSGAETTTLHVEHSSFARNSAATGGSALNFLSGSASSSIFNSTFRNHNSNVSLVRAGSPLQWVCQPGHWAPSMPGDVPQSDFVGCPNAPYIEEASLSFGPSGEHRLNCMYKLLENGQFDMTSTGCKFAMFTD